MRIKKVREEYFQWLRRFVGGKKKSKYGSYDKLLIFLHNTEFTWTIDMDSNRASDGKELRRRFGQEKKLSRETVDKNLNGPCSVLEMMVALAIRCERDVMGDPDAGDQTGQWFWEMVSNLGLGHMTDTWYDETKTRRVIFRLLKRGYEPDGTGGLFKVRNSHYDMRTVEIWYQLMWYLDERD